MLYVRCKNPDCRGEIKAPFGVRAQAAFFRVVNAEITCPFCRTSTTYGREDLHEHLPPLPGPAGARAGGSSAPGPSGPQGPSASGPVPR